MDLIRRRPLAAFFVLAYAIAWIAWAPLVLSRTGLGWLPFDGSMWLTIPGSYGPLIAALIVRRATHGDFRIGRLLPSFGRFAIGLLVGWLLIVAAFVVLPVLWLAREPLVLLGWGVLAAYPYGVAQTVLMAGPIGEEPGWRGFALPRLEMHLPPWAAMLVLGVIWGLWHLPLFLVPQWTGSPAWIYLLLIAAFSVVIGFAFELSRRSLLAAILLHAVFNASSTILVGVLGNAPLGGNLPPDLVIAGAFVLVAVVLAIVTRGRLAAPRAMP